MKGGRVPLPSLLGETPLGLRDSQSRPVEQRPEKCGHGRGHGGTGANSQAQILKMYLNSFQVLGSLQKCTKSTHSSGKLYIRTCFSRSFRRSFPGLNPTLCPQSATAQKTDTPSFGLHMPKPRGLLDPSLIPTYKLLALSSKYISKLGQCIRRIHYYHPGPRLSPPRSQQQASH